MEQSTDTAQEEESQVEISKNGLEKHGSMIDIYYSFLSGFTNVANAYLSNMQAKEERNKLCYAIEKVIIKAKNKIDKFQKKLNEKISDINTEYCSVDDKGNMLLENDATRSMKFTPEKFKTKSKKVNELIEGANEEKPENLLTINTYYATQVPVNLTFEQVYYFKGIVISPEDAKNIYGEEE